MVDDFFGFPVLACVHLNFCSEIGVSNIIDYNTFSPYYQLTINFNTKREWDESSKLNIASMRIEKIEALATFLLTVGIFWQNIG